MTNQPSSPSAKRRESPLTNLILTIVAPVAILNRLPKWMPDLSPWTVLIIALSLPIGAAIYNFARERKIGLLPGLGALNVLVSGSLAASGLGGLWFAVKEAFFPLLIGAIVFRTAFGANPFAKSLLLNESFVHVDRVQEALARRGEEADFHARLEQATKWISASFLLSAVLNFVLAVRVFEPLDEALSAAGRTQALNDQVAKMTGLGFAVIALPSMVCMGWIFWKLTTYLKRHTGLTDEEIFRG